MELENSKLCGFICSLCCIGIGLIGLVIWFLNVSVFFIVVSFFNELILEGTVCVVFYGGFGCLVFIFEKFFMELVERGRFLLEFLCCDL